MPLDPNQQAIAMLNILRATCKTTLAALQAADRPLDEDFRADLERLVERTTAELTAFNSHS